METGLFGHGFPSIYNHCGIKARLNARLGKIVIFCVFWKNDLLREKFQNYVPIIFIATPIDVLRSNFVKFGRWKIGKIVGCLPDKKNFAWLSCFRCADRAHCQGQLEAMYSECSRFHPNRFSFGGVIHERVNTIKTGRKVFP